jgi:hypothetical protein
MTTVLEWINWAVSEVTVGGVLLVLTVGSVFAYCYGIWEPLPGWILRVTLALLVFVIAYCVLEPYLMAFSAAVSGAGLAFLAFTLIMESEKLLLLLAGMGLLSGASFLVHKSLTANIVFVVILALVAILAYIYRINALEIFSALLSSLLYSWIAVYGVLYFYSGGQHGFTNSIEQIRFRFGCMATNECITHMATILSLAFFRFSACFYRWYRKQKRERLEKEVMQNLVEEHDRRKSMQGQSPSTEVSILQEEKRSDIDKEKEKELDEESLQMISELQMTLRTPVPAQAAAAAAPVVIAVQEEGKHKNEEEEDEEEEEEEAGSRTGSEEEEEEDNK